MQPDLLYQLALTLVPNVGDVHAKILAAHFGDAASIFRAPASLLEKIEGIGPATAGAITGFHDFDSAERELRFLEDKGVGSLFLTDTDYPQRLLQCYDPPALLFRKGQCDLNAPKIVAIVGTRRPTVQGKAFTENLVAELSQQQVLVVSGLAYGIDAVAHKAALQNGLPTVAVVGHGLDKVYPHGNKGLAREIEGAGAIVSEFFSGTDPDRHNFPLRNRIVAGLSDATIVIETDRKGGSMITAKLADAYHRDVFAVPGRPTDVLSSGCNHLIQHNKALLLTKAGDLIEAMGWTEQKKSTRQQRRLFIELSAEEETIVQLISAKEAVHVDAINLGCQLSNSAVAAALLNLELQGVIASLPGKLYKLL